MIIRERIGISLGKDALHYCCIARTVSSWQMAIPGSAMDPVGMIPGSGSAALREFLQRISPQTGRQIFLALPRSRFFVRDLQLPPIPFEDALLSIQSMLGVTCHLPVDEIYHDIFLCRLPDGKVNALVIYAFRKEIQSILEIFRELGHEKSLCGLFPISLGIGAWLSLQGYVMPMGLTNFDEGDSGELALYHHSGCICSVSFQNDAIGSAELQLIRESSCARFHLPVENVYDLDELGCMPLPDPVVDKLPWLPSIRQNPGVAALAAAMSDHQQVLLNGESPRIKVFQLWKVFVPLVVVLVIALSGWTLMTHHAINRDSVAVSALNIETRQLQQRVRPLEKTRDALTKVELLSADIEDFIRLRPRLFSCFNEMAKLVPDGTWFSRTNFQGADLTLQGQSKDALKVMESLRTSPLFEQVKLAGSVSRNPAGTEQFSLNIRLKDVEAIP